jgi:hypothetical protein
MRRRMFILSAISSLVFSLLAVVNPAPSNAILCPLGTVGVYYPPAQDEFGNTVFGYETCSADAKAAMDFYYDELRRIDQRIEQLKPKSGPDCVDLGAVYVGTSYEANYGVQCGSDVAMFTEMRANHIAWVTEQIRGTGTPTPTPTPTPIADGCTEIGFRYKNTQYQVDFGIICGADNIAFAQNAVFEYDKWVAAQTEPPKIREIIRPSEEQLLDPFRTKASVDASPIPTGTPAPITSPKASATPKASASPKNVTITCSKKKKTIKVTNKNPKCPKGYKKTS